MKYGKVDPADLQMADCPFEPGASAMVLCDYGEGNFEIKSNEGWCFTLSCHKRIKIFTKEGLDVANVSLPYYAGKTSRFEQISHVKAACYYLEQGAVKTIELPSKDIFTIKLGHDFREIKFAIPGARVGCVIEYSYEYSTQDLTNLKSWYFQEPIPVLYSECQMVIPDFFRFQNVLRGSHPLHVNETNFIHRSFQGVWGDGFANSVRVNTTTDCKQTRWVMQNLPSVRTEPYCSAVRDYTARIEFQLLGIQSGNGLFTEVMPSYEQFSKILLEDASFGKVADPGNFEKNLSRKIIDGITGPRKKAEAILRHLQEHIIWNGDEDKYAEQPLSKVYNEGKGSAAEINLMLTACLRAAGLTADPVLVGTRRHGRPHPVYPNADRFNYVLTAIEIDDKIVLADATMKDLPLGYISPECLNGEGWRVSTRTPGWIPLQENASGMYSTIIQLQLVDGALTGQSAIRISGYAAILVLDQVRNEGQESVSQSTLRALADWNPGVPVFRPEQAQPLVVCESPVQREIGMDNMLYIKSDIKAPFSTNPFTSETRQFPVDFPFARNSTIAIQLPVPEGYSIAELPKDAVIVFGENKDLVFRYNCSVANNLITLSSRLQMKRLFFLPDEYADLRAFFEMMAHKNEEMIVLKKIE